MSATSRRRPPHRGQANTSRPKAYEDLVRHTATPESPWFVVPADNKWFTRVVVAAAVIDALASLDLKYPKVGKAKRKELAAARRALLAEK